MSLFVRTVTAVLLFIYPVQAGAQGQDNIAGVFEYLHKEPMTLFDAGMKSLRRLAMDTAVDLTAKTGGKVTSSVSFSPTTRQIEIGLNLKTSEDLEIAAMRQKCVELRKAAILRMFRVGVSDIQSALDGASQLSTTERIRRRIGAQFAHEPSGSYGAFQTLGDRISLVTFFTLKLSTANEPIVNVNCRALVTDTMAEAPAK